MSDFLQTKTKMISILNLTWWIYSNDPTVSFLFSWNIVLNLLKLKMCFYNSEMFTTWKIWHKLSMQFSSNSVRIKVARLAKSVIELNSFFNGICCRPWSAESRTENFISIGHSVAEILNVIKVREINNFGNNFLFIFLIFVKVQLPIWQLIIYAWNRKQKFMERWDELWYLVVLGIGVEYMKSWKITLAFG